jgi:cold-inducible RNA-binding protein
MRIYVGNLSYSVSREQLSQLFSPFGEVAEVHMVTDRETGRAKGFAFVEMDDAGARKAISQLNDSALDDRNITVNEARPRTERTNSYSRDQRRW